MKAHVVLLAMLAVVGCSSPPLQQAASGQGQQKGKVGDHYYLNLFWPPVGGVITSSEAPTPRINCGASSQGAPRPDQNGVLQYDWQYYPGADRCGTRGQTQYAWAETAVLTAAPGAGFLFVGWAGDCAGTAPCTLTAGADKTVVAVFRRGATWAVSVARTGTGSGLITADVPGQPTVTCAAGSGSCVIVVPATTPPTLATLAVQPNASSHFTSWSGDCAGPAACLLTVDGDKAATASFALDVAGGTVIGGDGGLVLSPTGVTVTVPPAAIDTPAAFSVTVATSPPPPPASVTPISPIYQFEPAGQIFTQPVIVRLPVPSGVTSACIWWQQAYAAAYECIGGTIGGTDPNRWIETQVSHFSNAFVGPVVGVHTVQGNRINTHILSGGNLLSSPDRLELDTVAAWLTDADGGYSRFQGSGAPDGLFTLPGIPDGASPVVQVGPGSSGPFTLAATDQTNLDLGMIINGRLGLVPVATGAPMPMDLTIDGLEPYQPNGAIDVFSINADTWALWAEGNGFPAGSTTLHVADLQAARSRSLPMNVIDGARDNILVTQSAYLTNPNGFYYRQSRRHGVVNGVSVNPALPAQPASVTLLEDPQAYDVSLDWALPTYRAALLDTGAPPCTFSGQSFYVLGQASVYKVGLTGGEQMRTYLGMSFSPTAPPISTGLMTFGATGSPAYVQNYGLHANASVSCGSSVPGPFGSPFIGVSSGISRFEPIAYPFTMVSLVQPEISPPRNVRINGMPLSAPLTAVPDGPTISWDPPLQGTPDAYRILVFHLLNGPPGQERVGVLSSLETSIAIPPGLLQKGESYNLLVMASSNAFTVTRPWRRNVPATQTSQRTTWFTIAPDQHHVGGQVAGLTGNGLVLSTAFQPDLHVIAGASGFVFAGPVPGGTPYAVSVTQQPFDPPQVCTVANGTGTVTVGDVTEVVVTCL